MKAYLVTIILMGLSSLNTLSYFDIDSTAPTEINDPKPIASFNTDREYIYPGEEVQFTDYSLFNPTEWLWEFEGGIPAISTDQHPLVEYPEFGVFRVKLTVSNDAGTDFRLEELYIHANCSKLFYGDGQMGCATWQYADLGNYGTEIITPNFDDANSEPVPIGFEFQYNCEKFDHFILNTNGFVKFGSEPASTPALFFDSDTGTENGIVNSFDPADVNILSIFNHDLEGGDEPEYRVYSSGVKPNRKCIIQFKGVRDKEKENPRQFDNLQFQIHLFENFSTIYYWYGPTTPSNNETVAKSALVGQKGPSGEDAHLLLLAKLHTNDWYCPHSLEHNYDEDDPAFYFSNAKGVETGRASVMNRINDIDVETYPIYALGNADVKYSNPQYITAVIHNDGFATIQNPVATINITGANPFYQEIIVDEPLAFREEANVVFGPYTPTQLGQSQMTSRVISDLPNWNSSYSWSQEITENKVNYSSLNKPFYGNYQSVARMNLIKYYINNSAVIETVDFMINPHDNNEGQTISAVIMNEDGEILATSAEYNLPELDNPLEINVPLINSPILSDQHVLVGIACAKPNNYQAYSPLSYQQLNFIQPGTKFVANYDGSDLIEVFGSRNRYNIGMTLIPSPMNDLITAENYILCAGETAQLSYSGDPVNFQWQYSDNEFYGWQDVPGDEGSRNTDLITDPLEEGTYFRMKIFNDNETYVYSNTIFISINPVYLQEEEFEICSGESYLFPDGTEIRSITEDTLYSSILKTINDCDSVIETTILVNDVYFNEEIVNVCPGESFIFHDGIVMQDIQNEIQYTSNLLSVKACDSIIETTVLLYKDFFLKDTIEICQGDTIIAPDGTLLGNIQEDLIHESYFSTIEGCDSMIHSIVYVDSTYQIDEMYTLCEGDDYIFPDGSYIAAIKNDTTHISIFSTLDGCDSLITTAIKVHKYDFYTDLTNNTLTAYPSGANYTWLDCNAAFEVIQGENSQSYTPYESGNYAVMVDDGSCIDTTECTYVIGTGLESTQEGDFIIYPNPTNGIVYIQTNNQMIQEISIIDISGKELLYPLAKTDQKGIYKMDLHSLKTGFYMLKIVSGSGHFVELLIMNH